MRQCTRSDSRVLTDATGERGNPAFRQRFQDLRACRPGPNGESGINYKLRSLMAKDSAPLAVTDAAVQKTTGSSMSDREYAFLSEEYKALRQEINQRVAVIYEIEPNVVAGAAQIYSWIAAQTLST